MDDIDRKNFEIYGHRALNLSDFGYWSCHYCGQTGDDWMDPRDFACVKPEDEEKTRGK